LKFLEKINEKTRQKQINKKSVKLIFKDKLENNKQYKLIIKKEINDFLEKDIIKIFKTKDKLKVKDFLVLNYKKACLYTNNQIYKAWKKKNTFLEITP
jgi:hypothetical protein